MRRRAIALLLFSVCLAASAAVGSVSALAAAVQARQADELANSIGVAVHLPIAGTPYADDFPGVKARLLELGVRHIRDDLWAGKQSQYDALNALAAAGIGSDLIVGNPDEGEAGLDQLLGIVRTRLSGVEALEGANEYSTRGGAEWKAKLVANQEMLYDHVKGDPALAALPVLGPSIVHGDQKNLGDVSSFLDLGNIHSYPEGGPPEEKLETAINRAAFNSGTKPIWATETGYTNAVNWTPAGPGENKPISEHAAGVYVPRLFLEYFRRGIVRTYAYELVDNVPNPALDEREAHFGLLRNDLSRKPAFVALQNLIATLEDRGPGFAAGSLDYTLGGGSAPLRSVLLQKRDGSFYLALWRLESIWNPDTKTESADQPEPATVSLAQPLASYSVYEPSVAAAPVASTTGPISSFSVPVGAGLTIVRMVPTPPTPAEPPPGSPALQVASILPAPVAAAAPLDRATAVTARCTVPRLGGRTPGAARRAAREGGCALGTVKRRRSALVKSGRVVAQRPTAGRTLAPGTMITITVAR